MANYPAGTYEFVVTGNVGTLSDSITFTVNFVDPCLTAEITLLPSPLVDATYILRAEQQPYLWQYSDIFTIATKVDCGPISVDFFNEADESMLETELFSDERDAESSNTLTILKTQDVTKSGVYPISYRTYHTKYPDNFKEIRTAFTLTVIDPCDDPVSVSPSTLTDQEYTITQNAFDYQVPVYTADPLWCDISYTYTITDVAGDGALIFDPDT